MVHGSVRVRDNSGVFHVFSCGDWSLFTGLSTKQSGEGRKKENRGRKDIIYSHLRSVGEETCCLPVRGTVAAPPPCIITPLLRLSTSDTPFSRSV
uniref:Uncharacterized protein n=1 Tax=Mastacembelus armatus TaxID=205130 RepID=A0A3Q3SGG0_9TELE